MTDVKQQNAHQGTSQAQQQQSQPQPNQQQIAQQQVENQTIQVQQVQISHDGTQQMHAQGPQVVSSAATTMVMPGATQQAILSQQTMQNLQSPQSLSSLSSQPSAVATMNPQQQMADWTGHGRVQVIQQPIQNPTYIQPVYNAQGQLIMPGNIALHPANMNQPIQVITAGKPFQAGQMPHMLAQGKQTVVQGQATTFPGYATIPTSGNNQTLVISPLGVLGQNILPAALQQQGKPQDIQKMITKTNGPNSGMKVNSSQAQNVSISNLVSSQPQAITTQAPAIIQPQILSPLQYCGTQQQRVAQGPVTQFTPWQTFTPTQGLTWAQGAIQGSTLLAQGSQIFIRNPQHDAQPGMFIHNAQAQLQQPNQLQGQQITKTNQTIEVGSSVQPKTAITKTFSAILPNSVGAANIRPASSVSTQTGQTQTHALQANFQSQKAAAKVRTKNMCRMTSIASTTKTDAANQTKTGTPPGQILTPKNTANNGQPISTTPLSSTIQDNKIKQPQIQHSDQLPGQQPSTHQQAHTQQQQISHLHMQNLFQQQQQQVQGKPGTVPIMVNNGIPGTPDRAVLPVGAMPAAPMTPLMGNVIVQTVPSITAMTPNLPIPGAQTTQGVPIASQILPETVTIAEHQPEKQEDAEHKEEIREDGGPGTGPGRPGDEGTNSSEESGGNAGGTEEKSNFKEEVTSQSKEKSTEDKENIDTDKKNEKDGSGVTHPKAMVMVKPQVLTHVIEGFVIQESSEPFPVNRGYMEGGVKNMVVRDALENDEPPNKKAYMDSKDEKRKEYAVCQACGKKDLKSKFKKSKRFCSLSCSKREEDEKKNTENDNTDTNDSGREGSSSPSQVGTEPKEIAQDDTNKVNPRLWSVADVCEFIRNLPGCSDYAEDFAMQDIDGEALMLLKADHLMTVMSMKLGPAVKIIAKIDTMRVDDTSPPKQ